MTEKCIGACISPGVVKALHPSSDI